MGGTSRLHILLAILIAVTSATHVYDVYRMFQMDRDGSHLGSQRAGVNHLATFSTRKGSLARYIVMIPLADFDVALLDELINERQAEALLILLPRDSSLLTPDLLQKWRGYETQLFEREVKIPVYFAFEDQELKDLSHRVKTMSEDTAIGSLFDSFVNSADLYQMVLTGSEPTLMKEVTVANYQGWLAGKASDEATNPTIALVAHYDTFAVAPGLARGADSASGVVALLELSRLFSELYKSVGSHGRYNLLFVLTGGSRLNFAGAKHWLDKVDSRILESVEFSLCLDSIGNDQGLNLHVSRVPKEEPLQSLFEDFKSTAADMKIQWNVVHKKINISNPDVDWEHEQFSRKRVPGGTLSHIKAAAPVWGRSHVYDDVKSVNIPVLVRNIQFVAESLAKHIYKTPKGSFPIFSGSLAVDQNFVSTFLNYSASIPRAVSQFSKTSPFLQELENLLQTATGEAVTRQTFTLDSMIYGFYDASTASMTAYRVKGVLFDFSLSILVGIYLLAMYAGLRGVSETIREAKTAFAASSSKIKTK